MATFEDRLVTILDKYGHFEIYADGMFWASCDNWSEVLQETRTIYDIYGFKPREVYAI